MVATLSFEDLVGLLGLSGVIVFRFPSLLKRKGFTWRFRVLSNPFKAVVITTYMPLIG